MALIRQGPADTAMQIVCPNCATEHMLPDGSIGPAGRKVRCSGCREIWLATAPTEAEEAVVAPPAPAMPEPEHAAYVMKPGEEPDPFRDKAFADAIDNGSLLPNASESAEGVEQDAALTTPVAGRKAGWKNRLPGLRLKGSGALLKNVRPKLTVPGLRLPRVPVPRLAVPRFSPALLAVPAAIAIFMALVGFREHVVTVMPQMARLYALAGMPVNLRGLDIAKITSRVMQEGDNKLLLIEGEITNVSHNSKPIPGMRFAIRNAEGVELYVWNVKLDKESVAAGETFAFRRRLAAPPSDGREVLVRFVTKDDIVLSSNAATKP
jgi:predicted Zn finger-like uncharacterized protein